MLTREDKDGVAWLKLDWPEKLNAMPRELWAELQATLAELETDDVAAVVFHGAGGNFSVGGDIEGFGEIGGTADRRAYMREALGAYRALEEFPKPTIAAVHGNALGGGCELTMVCDVVIADETARFGTPEASVGLIPGPGIVRGLSHVNLHWMKYMVLSGETLGAEDARLAGLVNFVVPPGRHLDEAARLAAVMAKRSPLAQAVGKAFLGRDTWTDQQYAAEALVVLQGADDFAEGIAAFVERRRPDFPSRRA